MRTEQVARIFAMGKKCKRKNDEIVISNDRVLWYYHHNLIAEYFLAEPNKILIHTEWFTISTKRRLNMISRWRFYSDRGRQMAWHVDFGKQLIFNNEFIIYE